MLKACSKCGKIHNYNYKCYKGTSKTRANTTARKIRQSNKWAKKSVEIRENSKYLCSVCKDKGIYNYANLEVHHIIPIEQDNTKAFDNYNLICLCNACHREAEQGSIELEYLLKLAREREDNNSS